MNAETTIMAQHIATDKGQTALWNMHAAELEDATELATLMLEWYEYYGLAYQAEPFRSLLREALNDVDWHAITSQICYAVETSQEEVE